MPPRTQPVSNLTTAMDMFIGGRDPRMHQIA